MEAKKLGELINKLRTKKELTQLELANLLNISDKTVSKWESGKGFPEVTQLPEIAKIFEVSLDFLMNGETPNQQPMLMSKIEYCAKTDDVKLLTTLDIDAKDEDGHSLFYYIKKYESLKVLNYLIDTKKSYFFCNAHDHNGEKSIEDILHFALIVNRFDFIKIGTNRFTATDIKQFVPPDEKSTYSNLGHVTDKILKTIVSDKRVNPQTIDHLLSPLEHNGKSNYWTFAFPYILDFAYNYGNKELFERIISLAEKDNEEKIKLYYKMRSDERHRTYGHDSQKFSFGGYTVSRILETTMRTALSKQDYPLLDRMNKINNRLNSLEDFLLKCYEVCEYDIRMTKVQNDPKATEHEKKKQSVIFDGKVDLKKLIALGDFDVYSELKDSPAIEAYTLAFKDLGEDKGTRNYQHYIDNPQQHNCLLYSDDIRFYKEALENEKSQNFNISECTILDFVVAKYPECYDLQRFLLDNGLSLHELNDCYIYVDAILTQLLKTQLKILSQLK